MKTTLRRRSYAAAALAAAGVLLISPPASADTPPVVGVTVQQDDGSVRQAVDIEKMYPTASRQVVFFLDGPRPSEVRRVAFLAEDLVDVENGCVRPEHNTNDTTCGDDEGELSEFLQLDLTPGRQVGSIDEPGCEPLEGSTVSTTLREIASEPAVVGLPTADDVLCVVADFIHQEREGDNVTQTDAASFDLRLSFDSEAAPGQEDDGDDDGGTPGDDGGTPGDDGGPGTGTESGGDDDDTEVLGTKFGPPVTPSSVDAGPVRLTLPRTGIPLAGLLAGAGVLLGAGSALLILSGRRAQPHGSKEGL